MKDKLFLISLLFVRMQALLVGSLVGLQVIFLLELSKKIKCSVQ